MRINFKFSLLKCAIYLMPIFGFAQEIKSDFSICTFVTTPDEVVEALLNLAELDATDLIYDLGSGDGRIPIAAARKFGARA